MKNITKEYNNKWKFIVDEIKNSKTNDFLSLYEKINIKKINIQKERFIKNNWYIYDCKINNLTVKKIHFYKDLFLTNILLKKIIDYSEIIELGSGWGKHILYISEILKKKCFSGEINAYGLEAQKKIIKKCNLKKIKCFYFDYYNFQNSSFKYNLKNPVILTCNSIEQLKILPRNFYSNLKKYFKLDIINILHLEPVGYQFFPKHKLDKKHCDYCKKNRYNMNLRKVLDKTKYIERKIDKNIITCESKKKTIFSPISLVQIKL